MIQARSSDEHRVAVLALHKTVVRDPTEGDFGHGQLVCISGCTYTLKGLEVGFFPVPNWEIVLSGCDGDINAWQDTVPAAIVLSGYKTPSMRLWTDSGQY